MDILTQQVGGAGSAVADQEAPFELQQDPGVARSAGGGAELSCRPIAACRQSCCQIPELSLQRMLRFYNIINEPEGCIRSGTSLEP